MGEAGILTPEDRVELLEGWLVPKMTKNPPHAVASKLASKALDRILPSNWHTRIQDPILLSASVPEPDVAVARGTERDYGDRHPSATEVALIIEVADSSLTEDRRLKKRIYARDGIAVLWIVNLVDNRVEVYTDPTGPADQPDYRKRQDFSPIDSLPLLLEGRELGRIVVRDLLP